MANTTIHLFIERYSMLSEQVSYNETISATLPKDIVELFIAQANLGIAAKGREIITQSDLTHNVYYLKSGKVEISTLAPNSKKYVFREMGPGSIIGELSAIDGKKRSITVTAAEKTTYYQVSQSKFLMMIEENKKFRDWLLNDLVKKVRNISEQVFELSSMNVKCRILLDLIRRANKAGVHNDQSRFKWPKDQAQIATTLGTHREAVSREYSNFLKEKYILKENEYLIIPSFAKLEMHLSRKMGL